MAGDQPLLGFNIYHDAEEHIRQFLHEFESRHMKYLEEVLMTAKENFGRDDAIFLPKTPAVKNRTRKGRRVARRSSVEEIIPPKRSRASARQASKRQSSQSMSEFHKEALKNAAERSPPIATPPRKKIKEEILSPVNAAVETNCAPEPLSATVKEEVVEAMDMETIKESSPVKLSRATRASLTVKEEVDKAKELAPEKESPPVHPSEAKEPSLTVKEEVIEPENTQEEASPPAKRLRATRASTRASTARTAAKQGPKSRTVAKKGRGSKKKSSTEAESSQNESDASTMEKDATGKAEKTVPPPVKAKTVRASTRAATRTATTVRQSARSRLVQNVTQSPVTSTPGSVRGKRLCSKVAGTPKTPSTPGASRYKDHVKRLVQLHETEIAKVHTAEEASSPKRPRLGHAPCSPKTPKAPTSAASKSPFHSSPILSLKVCSKAKVPKEKPVQKKAQSEVKAKAVLGEEKAKEVSAFFSSLTDKVAKVGPPAETGEPEISETSQPTQDAGAVLPVDTPTKEILKDNHRSDDDDDKPDPVAAANDTALSQDSLEGSPPRRRSVRQSIRRSGRRSSMAVSDSKSRSSTYLRMHLGRQSTCSKRRSSARLSKRLSMAVHQMDRDSLEPTVEEETIEEPPAVRKSPRFNAQADEKNTSIGSTGSSSSSCGSDDIIDKTPSPECPRSKVVRPHPKSFLNTLNAGKKKKPVTIGTPQSGGIVTSFIQRNTPQKKTFMEQQKERKAQLLEKQKKEESIKKRLIEERRKNLADQKRLRDERMKRAKETRAQQEQEKAQRNQKMQEREEQKQTLTEKQKEERKRDEEQRMKVYEKKKIEAEERRKQEMEAKLRKIKEQEEEKRRHQHLMDRKREYEELERQRRAEEQRQQAEQLRLKQERLRQEELAKKREQQRLREEREKERKELERRRQLEAEQREKERKAMKEEAERQRKIAAEKALREKQRKEEMMEKEKAKKEHDRLKANILKQNTSINQQHNTSALNSTFNKEKVENSPQSYDLTPQRIYVAASADNYGIDDLHSDDSSDDEEAPRKKIPSWAQGGALKIALINQHNHPPDFQSLFPIVEPPDLSVMFVKKRARFTKRTSSAVWNSPIMHHLR
ncbi:inner centromere protein A-like isoform X2 [Lytechinus variegatus]|uniref:inner centromere protein A-like isoform X2 n=1 Tax=Lytechinus variegatus TaxID=7654 RepID=UPI001BB2492C|nr:inner centromere protein A-like isoform X2 [Lytechinus variegatus]